MLAMGVVVIGTAGWVAVQVVSDDEQAGVTPQPLPPVGTEDPGVAVDDLLPVGTCTIRTDVSRPPETVGCDEAHDSEVVAHLPVTADPQQLCRSVLETVTADEDWVPMVYLGREAVECSAVTEIRNTSVVTGHDVPAGESVPGG